MNVNKIKIVLYLRIHIFSENIPKLSEFKYNHNITPSHSWFVSFIVHLNTEFQRCVVV